MTRYARTQLLLGTLTIGAAASAVVCIRAQLWWHAVFCTFTALLLADAMTRTAWHHHQTARRLAEAMERTARPHEPHNGAFVACCAMWAASQVVHSAGCAIDTAMRTLDASCCEHWWTSLGAGHAANCRTRARKRRAA
ncbi:hypothetical protein OG897_06310 [Streptomyces sp. NBC_00237]|uniref:hypothetical protein n=1 Tax=Streptomyces sp. NBC_00237 TaxID=2975687 RepID=UPI00225545CC|nr:hypothetical protein [Streptomyces sp. NBC_00237]MCX5201075.1 hypothetical protein [Streptomyces sp. NBC_00237]